MSTRQWEIYTLIDPRTDQVRYVGVTFRGKQRFNEHMSRAVTGGKTHRDSWIRSLITLNLRPIYQIIEVGSGDGWQDAERRWIAHYRETCDLVNHTDGGDGTPGYVPTPELREKWSAMRAGVPYSPDRAPAMKGKHHTPEAKAKIAAAGAGRVHSATSREKLSRAHTGKVLSAEHRSKLSAGHQGKQLAPEHKQKIALSTTNRKQVQCVETGEIYPSVTATARSLGVTEASVNQAIRKGCRCKGLHFKFP